MTKKNVYSLFEIKSMQSTQLLITPIINKLMLILTFVLLMF